MEATLGSLGSSGLHPYSTQTPPGVGVERLVIPRI